jgi:hypothetical protein
VDIRGFKAFILDNFTPDTPIFLVLASEKDELDDGEIAGRAEVWMKLIKLSLPPKNILFRIIMVKQYSG